MSWIRSVSIAVSSAGLSAIATYAFCTINTPPPHVRPLFQEPRDHYKSMESFTVGKLSLRTPVETLQWVLGPGQVVNRETGLRYRVGGKSFGVDEVFLYFGIDPATGEIVSSGFVQQ